MFGFNIYIIVGGVLAGLSLIGVIYAKGRSDASAKAENKHLKSQLETRKINDGKIKKASDARRSVNPNSVSNDKYNRNRKQ